MRRIEEAVIFQLNSCTHTHSHTRARTYHHWWCDRKYNCALVLLLWAIKTCKYSFEFYLFICCCRLPAKPFHTCNTSVVRWALVYNDYRFLFHSKRRKKKNLFSSNLYSVVVVIARSIPIDSIFHSIDSHQSARIRTFEPAELIQFKTLIFVAWSPYEWVRGRCIVFGFLVIHSCSPFYGKIYIQINRARRAKEDGNKIASRNVYIGIWRRRRQWTRCQSIGYSRLESDRWIVLALRLAPFSNDSWNFVLKRNRSKAFYAIVAAMIVYRVAQSTLTHRSTGAQNEEARIFVHLT